MAERTLAQKLGLKPGLVACVINAPPHYSDLVSDADVALHETMYPSADFIHAFARGTVELCDLVQAAKCCMAVDGMLWISWPKKASGVDSALSFRAVRQCGLNAGLVDVKVCSVDAVWSALKFVYRKHDRVKMPKATGTGFRR